jgi:hypothetical protein
MLAGLSTDSAIVAVSTFDLIETGFRLLLGSAIWDAKFRHRR